MWKNSGKEDWRMSIALPEGMHVHSIIHAELLIRRADCLKIFGKAYERTQNVGGRPHLTLPVRSSHTLSETISSSLLFGGTGPRKEGPDALCSGELLLDESSIFE